MKNFRKVLALVLVVATLFSFASVAGAYTDDAKITADYSEAVGVLSAIGILNGYEDGSFKPEGKIDRDEMAKMIAVLANAGDDDVHTVYEGACNFADTTTNWAKSYIGYCAHAGIIAGRSATTFDPNGKVTGIETAKMLLVVLGFNAEEQGYVNVPDATYRLNVLRDAKNFGLFDGLVDFDPTAQITREQAAQMFMNALMSNIVIGTLSDNIVKISNAGYTDLDGLRWTLIDAEKYGITVVYGNVLVSTTFLIELFPGLDCDYTLDCHGRPGYLWTMTNALGQVSFEKFFVSTNKIAAYTKAAPLAADLKPLFAAKAELELPLHVYEDGVEVACTTLNKTTAANAAALTGNGVVTEVYVEAGGVYVVIINTYIGKVANVSARYNTYDLVNDNGTVKAGIKNTAGFSAGTIVLYWMCTDGRTLCLCDHSVVAAPSVTATITYTATSNPASTEASMFKADGKDYYYALTFGQHLAATILPASAANNVKKVIYTDLNGYVMYFADPAKAPATPNNVALFLPGTITEYVDTIIVNGKGNGYKTVDMIDFTATKNTVKADDKLLTELNNRVAENKDLIKGALLKYVDGDTKTWVATSAFVNGDGLLSSTTGEIINGELYGNNDTKYLIKTPAGYQAVTGYKNLDKDYLAKHLDGDKVNIQYFDTFVIDTDGDGIADKGDKIAEYVYIDAAYTTTYTMFYVLGNQYAASWNEIYSAAKAYNVYDVLVNGEKAVLAVAEDDTKLENGLYSANLVLLGADAAMLKDGTKVDLYVNVDEILGKMDPADLADDVKYYGNGFAISLHNGQLKIADTSASENFSYLDVADELTVIDITYAGGVYKGYEVLNTIRSAEWDATSTWFFLDGNGDVYLIIREIV